MPPAARRPAAAPDPSDPRPGKRQEIQYNQSTEGNCHPQGDKAGLPNMHREAC